ncbi:ABC transporter substrate-binding protein [Aquisalimonas sp.]|uniref:ABC transporter substrate-binding protein n=1 Tax=unclassified Aquisalimonas TaxID=2644645 RepID=UPI0025B922A7|nr:ABC transporter substrate-binding protein [Aquisalimonas sp.]
MSMRKRTSELFLGTASAALLALMTASTVLADQPDEAEVGVDADEEDAIVIGGSIPMTGVFAFAGLQFNDGIRDFVRWANEEKGGVNGRKFRYVGQDTGYDADQSVGVFRRITSREDVDFYFGDSTAFSQSINSALNRRDILMTGASFASELNNPEQYPLQFLLGPDYTEQVGILLNYIAEEDPGARVALVHSDTEFGRDPIRASEEMAEELGLEHVETIVTPAGASDISSAALELRRARPDYTIFHGYILSPIPDFIQRARQMGMDTRFMGTIYTMDQGIIDEMGDAGDGFMGVMPYRYYYDEEAPDTEVFGAIHEMHDEYRATTYTQGWLAGMLLMQIAQATLDAGDELTGTNMRKALDSLEDIDTGGIIGVPVTFRGNSIPVGRIYRADAEEGRMVPVSDWIDLDETD